MLHRGHNKRCQDGEYEKYNGMFNRVLSLKETRDSHGSKSVGFWDSVTFAFSSGLGTRLI